MNLPENYIVICDTREETNIVKQSQDKYKNRDKNHWAYWRYCTFKNEDSNIFNNTEQVVEWFEDKNISDYKTFTFKEWKEMKENKTPPQYWYIEITEETLDAVNKVIAKQKQFNEPLKLNDYDYYGFNSNSVICGISKEFIHKKAVELSLDEFKFYFLKEEFVFPERWCILATKENFKEISDFYVKHANNSNTYKSENFINWYFHSHCNANISIYNHKNFSYCNPVKREEFKEVSFEQFKEHVLKQANKMKPYEEDSEVTCEMITTNPYFKTLSEEELCKVVDAMDYEGYCKLDGLLSKDKAKNLINKFNNKNMKLTVSITDVLEIHKIACSTWKSKIVNYLTKVDSDQNITFTQSEVDEMFKAATTEQKPVLTKIFGEQNIIEWDKIKTGSKVMIKNTDEICSGNWDKSKHVDVVFYKTKHLITGSAKFKSEGYYNSYCTFHQNSNFILFNADISVDYITEVIEY